MADYNVTRFTRQVLKRYRKEPPSLVLHLYTNHFRFQEQHGNFAYDSPMKCFLEAIREQKLPTDLLDILDSSKVIYYEGCLIVEVHDHRSTPSPSSSSSSSLAAANKRNGGLALSFQPNNNLRDLPNLIKVEIYRIVLGPNPATLWTDLNIFERRWKEERKNLNNDIEGGGAAVAEEEDWTEERAVELEALILNRTTPALCLSPSLQTSRIANSMLRATTLRPLKRKRFNSSNNGLEGGNNGDEMGDEMGEEGNKKEREERERIMKIGDEGVGRAKGHAFSRLAFIQSYRERQAIPLVPTPAPLPPLVPTATPTPTVITSLRLGGPSLSSGSTTPLPAHSPPTSNNGLNSSTNNNNNTSTIKPINKKKISIVSSSVNNSIQVNNNNNNNINISSNKTDSEAGTPQPSTSNNLISIGSGFTSTSNPNTITTTTTTKKLSKKQATALALAGSLSLDPTDPSLPTDPIEKERILSERKKALATKKRLDAKAKVLEKKKQKQIEEMRAEAAANNTSLGQGLPGDLQVGGTPGLNGRGSWN